MRPDFSAGFHRLADPKISLASLAAILLGSCAAAADGPLHWGWLALTVLGIFALEVAKNASGEVVDFDSGVDLAVAATDRSPFSGGKRVLVDGLLTRGQTIGIALAAYGVGVAAGIAIALAREPAVLWLGVVGVACAYFYHALPLRLSYRGWGELAVVLCYGPLIASGTYLVQRGRISGGLVAASLPLGLLIGAFLWINEFPDWAADRASGKRTLVVRLGRKRACLGFVWIVAAAFALLLVAPALAGLPRAVWLGGAAAVPAAFAARRLWREPEVTARIVPAQVATLLAFVLYALAAGLGFLIGGARELVR